MKHITLLTICILLAIAPTWSEAPLATRLASAVEQTLNGRQFSGSVLVARAGQVVFEQAWGSANPLTGVETTSDTRYNVGSVGKLLTAVLVLQLWQEGRIDLDAPLSSYVATKVPNADRITIRQLLSHTSGLGNYMNSEEFRTNRASLRTIDDVLQVIEAQPLAFDFPGSRYAYSNSGFIVLGKVLEAAEGKPYQQILRERILVPAQMVGASLEPPSTPSASIPFRVTAAGVQDLSGEEPVPSSDGGLFVRLRDLLLFDQALRSELLLGAEAQRLMNSLEATGIEANGMTVRHGLGTILFQDSPRVTGHLGGSPGRFADFRRTLDERGDTVVLASNSGTPLFALAEALLKVLQEVG